MIKYINMIEALTVEYLNVYVVEPERDFGEIVKLDGYEVKGISEISDGFCYSEMLRFYAENNVLVEDREDFLAAFGPESLIQKFARGLSHVEKVYRVEEKGEIHHYYGQFTRISKEGEPLCLVSGFRNVDSFMAMGRVKQAEGMYNAYSVLSDIYLAMYRVDVKNNTYTVIKTTAEIMKYSLPGSDEYDATALNTIRGIADRAYWEDAIAFSDRSTLPQRLHGKQHISMEFLSDKSVLCKLHFLREDEDKNGELWHVIFAVEPMDTDRTRAALDALTRNFTNVFTINLEDGDAGVLKMRGYISKEINEKKHKKFYYPEILKDYVAERVHPEDREAVLQAMDIDTLRRVFRERTEYTGNYRILVDGEAHHYQFRFFKPETVNYVVVGFQNVDDIVEKQRLEEEKTREKELAFRHRLEEQVAIFDALSRNFKNVYLVNLEAGTAKILKLGDEHNDGRLDGMGSTEFVYEELMNSWIAEAVVPEDREMLANALSAAHLREVFAREKEYIGNYRMDVGGKIIYYQFSLTGLENNKYIIAGFQNVDSIIRQHLDEEKERREKEQLYQKKLVEAAERAEAANRAKTEFLLRMSHDIRTPLNGMIGMIDIADRYSDDIEKQNECRSKAKESTRVLLELINEVLDMSKLESGEVVLENVSFDLNLIPVEIFTVVSKQAEERGIEIIQGDYSVKHNVVIGSPNHYKRLIMNIVSNAVKYNKDFGKIYLSFTEKEEENGKAFYEFTCRDTGIGMSKEFQKHVFEPFAQENSTLSAHYEGTGLGMSIAKTLTDKMGGTIEFESEKGVGTTFTVTVPFRFGETDGDERANEGEENFSIRGMNIILAEDNDLNMEIARFLLEEQGAHVIEAHDGQEAVQAFTESKPGDVAAILMDIMMPVMNGYEAAKKIRGLDRDDSKKVPIIAMTANAFVEDRIAAKEAGMDEHIAKPFEAERAVRIIGTLAEEYKNKQR